MFIQKASEMGEGEIISEDDFRALSNQTDRLYLIALLIRPGVASFTTKLEFEHFPPLSAKNDELDVYILEWFDLPWTVVSIPMNQRSVAESVAAEVGLRFTDGIPLMFGDGKEEFFPLSGSNVFSLENIPGSPVYDGFKKAEELRHADIQNAEEVRTNFQDPIRDVLDKLKHFC